MRRRTAIITALYYAKTLIGNILLIFPATKHTIIHILECTPELSVEHVIFYLIYLILCFFGSSETILDVVVILEILPKR